jgi:hypothetical protein
MLLHQTHRCCHPHHHAATAFPNAPLLPLKMRFNQAAAFAAKLAATTVLPPPPPLTAALPLPTNKNVILLTHLFLPRW